MRETTTSIQAGPCGDRARRVLVVEDDASVRGVLTLALTAEGYELQVAQHGQEALACLSTWRPDLILLDLRMPVMDGWEFRCAQLADAKLAGIPVVVVTALPQTEVVAADASLAAVLAKPFRLDLLLETVARFSALQGPAVT